MENSSIHIIAEAGSNNNGQLSKAKELADIAKRSNADSVKFQLINTWGLYLPGEYEYGHYDVKKVLKFRQDGEMTDREYEDLAEYCKTINIPFTASVFDEKGLELMLKFDPAYIKLASCDINNVRFLRQIAETGRKIVFSTGMSTLNDVEKAVNVLVKGGANDLVIMHCVSVYPARLKQTNLRFIEILKSEFGFPVGFSDHTGNSIAACIALSLGATWFEKHFTEDKNQDGLDHKHAMEERGLTEYIQDIHDAETALQLKAEKISDDERYTRKRARRSLYAAFDLPAGHIVRNEDVLCVRPEGILDADQIDVVVGSKVTGPVKQYEAFTYDNLVIKR
jgi:sialic acid synthase SpsE